MFTLRSPLEKKGPKNVGHLPLVGGFIGGSMGFLFSMIFYFRVPIFVILNTLILGTVIGGTYGGITAKIFSRYRSLKNDIKKGVAIGSVLGALLGLHVISFGIFVFGYGFSLFYLLIAAIVDENRWPLRGKLIKKWKALTTYLVPSATFGAVSGLILWGELGLIAGLIIGAIPGINIGFGFILGSFLGVAIMENIALRFVLFVPLFQIPLLAGVGYFVGRKIDSTRDPEGVFRRYFPTHKTFFISFAIAMGVLILLSFLFFIVPSLSITPFLTYPYVMRIVVVAVSVYIGVSVFRVLTGK